MSKRDEMLTAKVKLGLENGPSRGDVKFVGSVRRKQALADMSGMFAAMMEEFVGAFAKELDNTDGIPGIGVEIAEALIQLAHKDEKNADAARETCASLLLANMAGKPMPKPVRDAMVEALRAANGGDIMSALKGVRESTDAKVVALKERARLGDDNAKRELLAMIAKESGQMVSGEKSATHDHVSHNFSFSSDDSEEAKAEVAKMSAKMPKHGETPNVWFERTFGRPVRSAVMLPAGSEDIEQIAESMFMTAMTAGKLMADMPIDRFAMGAATGFAKAVIEAADSNEQGQEWLSKALGYLATNIQMNAAMQARQGKADPSDTIGKTVGTA